MPGKLGAFRRGKRKGAAAPQCALPPGVCMGVQQRNTMAACSRVLSWALSTQRVPLMLVGPPGCGKRTALRAALQVAAATTGRAHDVHFASSLQYATQVALCSTVWQQLRGGVIPTLRCGEHARRVVVLQHVAHLPVAEPEHSDGTGNPRRHEPGVPGAPHSILALLRKSNAGVDRPTAGGTRKPPRTPAGRLGVGSLAGHARAARAASTKSPQQASRSSGRLDDTGQWVGSAASLPPCLVVCVHDLDTAALRAWSEVCLTVRMPALQAASIEAALRSVQVAAETARGHPMAGSTPAQAAQAAASTNGDVRAAAVHLASTRDTHLHAFNAAGHDVHMLQSPFAIARQALRGNMRTVGEAARALRAQGNAAGALHHQVLRTCMQHPCWTPPSIPQGYRGGVISTVPQQQQLIALQQCAQASAWEQLHRRSQLFALASAAVHCASAAAFGSADAQVCALPLPSAAGMPALQEGVPRAELGAWLPARVLPVAPVTPAVQGASIVPAQLHNCRDVHYSGYAALCRAGVPGETQATMHLNTPHSL